MTFKYDHKKIETKWQKYWLTKNVFAAVDKSAKPKYYCLIEFPYPSGDGLHVGHLRSYTALDILARKRRMQGYNVMYPIGFDAFGLPSENYAIKTGIHPQTTTENNIKIFTRQLQAMGFSFDWQRAVTTTDPKYYKWTQWIFLKMYEKGLAYKAKIPINWCLSCKIGLANEEVVNGRCERCGGPVEKRQKEQWLFKITDYADRLLEDLDSVDYLERIKIQQQNWIGRSEGAEVNFQVIANGAKQFHKEEDKIASSAVPPRNDNLTVFTTRPDTLFGATFMVIAPEHPLILNLKNQISNLKEVEKYIAVAKKKSDLERTEVNKEKTGLELKGLMAINPVNNKEIPVFVADYVLISYGTGAIMAVPAHDQRDFEFAKKYGQPVTQVIEPTNGSGKKIDLKTEAYEEVNEGVMINSGRFNGLSVGKCINEITAWLAKRGVGRPAVNYKLRDWIFSRQRYWGEPIPIIYCRKCLEAKTQNSKSSAKGGPQPEADAPLVHASSGKSQSQEGVDYVLINGQEYAIIPLPENYLPLELPKVKSYEPTDSGESPLAAIADFVNTRCPFCGGQAIRETDTMPNWAGSNWYFLRYADPDNNKALADKKNLAYFLPVDWYNGGMEHTTLHLLYSRFIYKFLWDLGAVPESCGPEPYQKRTSHGMVLGSGGEKMSKSRGNVVNPDQVVAELGADTLRCYEMFMGPFDQAIPWDTKGVIGVRRFLEKVWQTFQSLISQKLSVVKGEKLMPLLHRTIKKVSADIESQDYNTAISALMIFINQAAADGLDKKTGETFLKILSPFAPHLVEELWQQLGHKRSIIQEPWPEFDEALAQNKEIELVIQINGRVKDKMIVPADINEQRAEKLALDRPKVLSQLAGKQIKNVIFIPGRLINFVV